MTVQDGLNSDAGVLTVWVGTLAGVFYTIFKIVQSWQNTKTINSRSNAEVSLYETLKNQIEDHASLIATLQDEKTSWLTEKATLNSRIARLEEASLDSHALKLKLEVKDKQISELINEVVRKTAEITELRERVHMLEIRLHKDESSWCTDCRFKRSTGTNDDK